MNERKEAEQIFLAGVRSVLPGDLITRVVKVIGNELVAGDKVFNLDQAGRIFVIGAGKASAAMAHYIEVLLGNRIAGGHVSVKYGHSCKLKRIKVTEAGHPVPDVNSFKATSEILEIASEARENDIVICLISGGGSALLADVPEGCFPEGIAILNNLLVRSGADINEINCVRKHLSGVKGGQLAKIVWPATLVSIILSDVIGNPLEVIASGPTVPDSSTFADALDVIERYGLADSLTADVLNHLREGALGNRPETPKPGDYAFSKTFNILAGTNLTALRASMNYAESLGYKTIIVDSSMQGLVPDVSRMIIDTVSGYRMAGDILKPFCLLYGGETTLKVEGEGVGGRNQHLALSIAIGLIDKPGITVLCAGTDGNDGPTDAAGAVVDCRSVVAALEKGKDAQKYLEAFDSYNFFKASGGHIITGPTFTNVMDIVVILVT